MENEKLENQRIDESKMENVAGGYEMNTFPSILTNDLLLEGLSVDDKEYSKLDKKGYIKHTEISGEEVEYVSKSELKKALKLLNKDGEVDIPDEGIAVHKLGIF